MNRAIFASPSVGAVQNDITQLGRAFGDFEAFEAGAAASFVDVTATKVMVGHARLVIVLVGRGVRWTGERGRYRAVERGGEHCGG